VKILNISAAAGKWWVVTVSGEKLTGLPVELWALVQFGEQNKSDLVPVIMGPGGPEFITDPIGTPSSKYLGYCHTYPPKENEWGAKKKRYLSQAGPS